LVYSVRPRSLKGSVVWSHLDYRSHLKVFLSAVGVLSISSGGAFDCVQSWSYFLDKLLLLGVKSNVFVSGKSVSF